MKRKKIFLIIILLVACVLRLWGLSKVPISLFGDELDVGYHAYSVFKTGRDYYGNFMPLHFHSIAEWRTPLYIYAAVPTVAVFGISSLGVRLPAAIFGIFGIWGMYLMVTEVVKYPSKRKSERKETLKFYLPLLAALLLTLSPWHIQYSRAAFEVTQLIAFLLFGLYFFFRSLQTAGKNLWLSVVFLTLTPWIYSTAKLFTPLLMIFLFIVWRKEILSFSKNKIISSIVAGVIIGLPVAYSTVFGGGTQRAAYTSVFTNPTVEHEVGVDRLRDAEMRGEVHEGLSPELSDRIFHNKFTLWWENISRNFLESFSFNFLFNVGDPNPRHSVQGVGQFYIVELIPFVLGLVFFFISAFSGKLKALVMFWVIAGAFPASLTRDGGNHATRLILILPPLIFLIAYGIYTAVIKLNTNIRKLAIFAYAFILLIFILFYQHTYWVHYPWDSERWWHAGFKEAIQYIKEVDSSYERVVITMSGEPAWIFFAGWYEYPPSKWQENFPIENKVFLEGFGEVSYIDRYYFGSFSPEAGGIYDLPEYISAHDLYLASATEIGVNLIREPERTPPGLSLEKAVSYPSGEPAFYLFSGTKQ